MENNECNKKDIVVKRINKLKKLGAGDEECYECLGINVTSIVICYKCIALTPAFEKAVSNLIK